ncbi:MAG: hypothetical protein Q4D89_04350 [Arachnia propionica]|uniref:hypothetical protein n=1 Tax=Arachnia propionica TaxID=1750 RepID=UPI0026F6C6F8|nr:hypothetical protein [Arachnia propionica]
MVQGLKGTPIEPDWDVTTASRHIAALGVDEAVTFISRTSSGMRRFGDVRTRWHGSAQAGLGAFSLLGVHLVHDHDLPVPRDPAYLADWGVIAGSFTPVGHYRDLVQRNQEKLASDLTWERLAPRVADHLDALLALRMPPTEQMIHVLTHATLGGHLDRTTVLGLTFLGLFTARGPKERKLFSDALAALDVTAAEIAPHQPHLIDLLTLMEPPVVNTFGPLMIRTLTPEHLLDVALPCLAVRTAKGQLLALDALLARGDLPADQALVEQVAALVTSRNAKVRATAAELLRRLGASPPEPAPVTVEVRGLWQPGPTLWTVPRMEHPTPSFPALGDLLVETQGRCQLVDEPVERLLAMVVSLARIDADQVRRMVRPRGERLEAAPSPGRWAAGGQGLFLLEPGTPLAVRSRDIAERLGELPCLLSTPTTVDLAVNLDDFAAGLAHYHEAGVAVGSGDLQLALQRLAPGWGESDLARLEDHDVPVLGADRPASHTVLGCVRAWLREPLTVPTPVRAPSGYWVWPRHTPATPWLPALEDDHDVLVEQFPLGGDGAHIGLDHSGEVDESTRMGQFARQLARSASPLGPAATTGLLGVQRPVPCPTAGADAAVALREAWQRGLLHTGVADAEWLDRGSRPLRHLPALARALREVAGQGMLSVVWSLLDGIVGRSLTQERLAAGTTEIVELMAEFLPEVRAAVDSGLAAPRHLDLPATRDLAARKGSARAVMAARALLERLS